MGHLQLYRESFGFLVAVPGARMWLLCQEETRSVQHKLIHLSSDNPCNHWWYVVKGPHLFTWLEFILYWLGVPTSTTINSQYACTKVAASSLFVCVCVCVLFWDCAHWCIDRLEVRIVMAFHTVTKVHHVLVCLHHIHSSSPWRSAQWLKAVPGYPSWAFCDTVRHPYTLWSSVVLVWLHKS